MFESVKLYINQEIEKESLLKSFLNLGYRSCGYVAQEGDFSHRGGIVDIFPSGFEEPLRIEFIEDKIHGISSFSLVTSNMTTKHQMVIILAKKAVKVSSRRMLFYGVGEEVPLDNFVDIDCADHVVHVDHGIGIYRGMKKMKHENAQKDFMIIEYADKDKLYVPADEINLIQKYISFYRRAPKLSKLGTKTWQKIKDKTKRIAASYAMELLHVQASRIKLKGFSFSKDTDWQQKLEDAFPYKDTIDQAKASEEVKADMEEPKPMDRLLCGDVGYGKTEVALRAAFKAVMDNKQVAILVPTTILAEQHCNTFYERMKDFPVDIQMLSRFKTKAEQKNVIEGLKEGSVDIVIGTHRLLSDDLRFKNLGLVIIDEEQRFGVKAKEKLKKLRLLVDVLTMTATPIPRTLYLSLMDARDMSAINTPPLDRLPIETTIAEYSDKLIKEAIGREVSRKGQVYYVNNRIRGIGKIAEKLKELMGKEIRIATAHGRMASKELEHIMLEFIQGKIDVLVSTTIIESGIDIPNANTIIINRADQFGLADLYQLRGRVGRFNARAYALFLVPKKYPLAGDAKRRLKAVSRFTELGSGFKIAMEDLQIRGAGNILGTQQHGYISAVGFDLYCRLLREIISEHKQSSG
ncbi:MAG: transcription-repair coupling factor [Candidatus Omnitrophota bacterium]